MSCQVAYCRYKFSHTTSGHRCGLCGKYGHGQSECGNQWKIDQLNNACSILDPFCN